MYSFKLSGIYSVILAQMCYSFSMCSYYRKEFKDLKSGTLVVPVGVWTIHCFFFNYTCDYIVLI